MQCGELKTVIKSYIYKDSFCSQQHTVFLCVCGYRNQAHIMTWQSQGRWRGCITILTIVSQPQNKLILFWPHKSRKEYCVRPGWGGGKPPLRVSGSRGFPNFDNYNAQYSEEVPDTSSILRIYFMNLLLKLKTQLRRYKQVSIFIGTLGTLVHKTQCPQLRYFSNVTT